MLRVQICCASICDVQDPYQQASFRVGECGRRQKHGVGQGIRDA